MKFGELYFFGTGASFKYDVGNYFLNRLYKNYQNENHI